VGKKNRGIKIVDQELMEDKENKTNANIVIRNLIITDLFFLVLSVLSLGFKVKYNLICTCTPVRRKGQRKRNECQYYNML